MNRIERIIKALVNHRWGIVSVLLIFGLAGSGAGLPGQADTLNERELRGQEIFFKANYGNRTTAAFPPENVLIALQVASSGVPTNDPTVLFLRSVLQAKGIVFAPYFENYGWIRDPGNPSPFGLPIGMGRTPIDGSLDFTCAACHSGRLPTGEFKIGMPNTRLNLGAFFLALNEVLNLGFPDSVKAGFASWGPGRLDDIPDHFDGRNDMASNVPAHWGDLDQWKFFEWGAETRDYQERNAFVYFLLGVDPSFGVLPPDEDMRALTDFVRRIKAPVNPNVDAAAAERGRRVFDSAGCRSCHNGPDLMNNNMLVPVVSDRDRMPREDRRFPNGSIATDPQRICLARVACGDDILPSLRASGITLVGGANLKVAPLTGAWATAPYLHNGSVPTLRDLLEPQSGRPVTFPLPGGFVFDTRLPGNSNQGHEFGVNLSAQEKNDLVAYLNSL